METIKSKALHLLKKRVSVIPVDTDKRPLIKWKHYQTELMDEAEADRLFTKSPGLAVVCGAVSQGLEVMDFDLKHDKSGTLWQRFTDTIKIANPDLWDAVKSGIVRTKNNGYHIYYFCENPDSNMVLARNPDQTVLIETRGEGGYVVAPPSPGYEMVGDGELKELTKAERDYLHEVARRFNEPAKEFPPVPAPSSDITPWDDFNSRVSGIDILKDSGWTVTKRDGDRVYLKRPGESDADHSGNYHEGHGMFYCHSTSTRLPNGEGLTPYALLTHLHYNGDFKESAKDLRSKGYGSTSTTTVQVAVQPTVTNKTEVDGLMSRLVACRTTSSMTVAKSRPVLTIQGKTISTAGNITTLVGMSKAGKSAWNSAGMAGCLNSGGKEIDTLGLDIVPSDGRLVLYWDTEQPIEDHHRCLRSILKRCGRESEPDYFMSFNTLGMTPSENIELFMYALEFYGSKFGGVHSIWLDGPADFVNSVNDEKEVNALVTLLQRTARNYNCPIFNTLHFNPNSDSKGRGHLGSAFERKSGAVLSLKKDEVTGVSTCEPLKGLLRHSDSFNPLTFQYCPEHGYHVSRGVVQTSKSKKEHDRREVLCDMWHLFEGGKRYMTAGECADKMGDFYGIRNDSARRKMGQLVRSGILERNYDLKKPVYRLNSGLVAGGGFATTCH